jgi:hypothetical protein
MQFTWTKTGDRVFDGPPVHRGLLAGFSVGAQRWTRKVLQLDSLDSLDGAEVQILYYVLSLKQIDHNLLPVTRASFDDLTLLDFDIAAHPFVRDADDPRETCRECNQVEAFRNHVEAEADPTLHSGQEEAGS